MKKNDRVLGDLSHTSLQTQLFSIILMSFILFLLFNYLIVVYSFKNRYVESEINISMSQIEELSKSVNEDDENLALKLNDYYEKSGAVPLFIDSSGGGHKLINPIYTSYEITVESENEDYVIKLSSFSIGANVGDNVTSYIKKI